MKYRIEYRRGNVKNEPIFVQEKWFLNSKEYEILKALKTLINEEKSLPKNIRNENLLLILKSKCSKITNGYDETYGIFGENCVEYKSIDKHYFFSGHGTKDALIILSKKIY